MDLSLAQIEHVAPLPDLSVKIPPQTVVHIPANQMMHHRCAWCDEEAGFRCVGNVSHRICFNHMASNLWFSLPKDSVDTLFYALLCQLGTEAR